MKLIPTLPSPPGRRKVPPAPINGVPPPPVILIALFDCTWLTWGGYAPQTLPEIPWGATLPQTPP